MNTLTKSDIEALHQLFDKYIGQRKKIALDSLVSTPRNDFTACDGQELRAQIIALESVRRDFKTSITKEWLAAQLILVQGA